MRRMDYIVMEIYNAGNNVLILGHLLTLQPKVCLIWVNISFNMMGLNPDGYQTLQRVNSSSEYM